MSVTLSVVIPVYNSEKYLKECIDSIINQIFTDMEIILVDNKSTDTSGMICDEYMERDSRIKVIHREKHGWVGDSRNDGIEEASGEWITFVDSDDWLEPDCYERVLEKLNNRDVDIFCEGGRFIEYPNKKVTSFTCWGDFDYSSEKELNTLRQNIVALFFKKSNITLAVPWDKFYKMEFIRKNHLRFAEDILFADDVYFNFIAFSSASRIAGCNYIGYHYRQINDSIMHGYKPDCPDDAYHFLQELQNHLDKNIYAERWNDVFAQRVIWVFGYMLKHYFFHSQNKTPYLSKKKEIEKWKQKEIYRKVICSKSSCYLTQKQIVLKLILRTPFVFPLALLVWIQNWRERANL